MGYRLCSLSPVFCLLSLLLFLPNVVSAAEYRLISDTILRGFEGNTQGDDDFALPIYEYLQADIGEPGERPLSFHLYGWGRTDLAGSDYFEDYYNDDSTAGELLYGYAEYRHPDSGLMARLGRQYIFSGVTSRALDGLRVDTGLTPLFTLSAYAGRPVSVDSNDQLDNKILVGGRIAHQRRDLYEIGLSYQNFDSGGDRELLGIDTAFFLPGGVNFSGFSSLDLGGTGWAEHFYEVNFNLGPFRLRPFFEHYKYENYFDHGADTGGPFRFLVPIGDTLTIVGSDAIWEQEDWEFGVKGKYYDYDERGGSSFFFSGLANRQLEGLSQVGGELGRMEGDGSDNDYLLARAFVYWDQIPPDRIFRFLTGDLVYVRYDEDIYGEDNSLFLSVGAGRRFLSDRLELRLSGDYSFDPYYDNDLRGWLLARYTFER